MKREGDRENGASTLSADRINSSQTSTCSQSVRPNRKSHPFGDLTHRAENVELLYGLQFGAFETLNLVDVDIWMVWVI